MTRRCGARAAASPHGTGDRRYPARRVQRIHELSQASHPSRGTATTALFVVAAFIIVCAGLRAASDLIVPFLAAVFLAIVSLPPLAALRRSGVPSWAAISIVLLVVLGVLIIFGWVVSRSLSGFLQSMTQVQAVLHEDLGSLAEWLRQFDIDVSAESLEEQLGPSRLLATMGNALKALASAVHTSFFVILTWSFIIAEAAMLPEKLGRALGTPGGDLSRYRGMVLDVQRYLSLKCGTNLLAALLVWFSSWILGTPYAVPVAVFAFLLNFVPVFGPIIAAVPAVLLTLAAFGWERALVMIGLHVALNVVVGSVVEPRLFGARFGLSSLVVFLSLVFWGWILGPIGMVLSVPLTIVVKIVLSNTAEFRWVAVLLGGAGDSLIAMPPGPAADRDGSRGATRR